MQHRIARDLRTTVYFFAKKQRGEGWKNYDRYKCETKLNSKKCLDILLYLFR